MSAGYLPLAFFASWTTRILKTIGWGDKRCEHYSSLNLPEFVFRVENSRRTKAVILSAFTVAEKVETKL